MKTEIREDVEEKIREQERKIANNSDQSKKNEILFQTHKSLMVKQMNESDAKIIKQKIENEALAEEVDAKIAKQEEKTASMLSTIFSNIIGVVRADEAHIQELEGKILTNLEKKIDEQKIENEALLQEVDMKIDKQKNETAHLLGIIFSNITRTVSSGMASTGIESYIGCVFLSKYKFEVLSMLGKTS